MKLMRYRSQAGQIALVVLLIAVVLLTVGVAVITRSTTDISQSRQEEETSRVFNAAEAGIEDALRQDLETLSYTGNIYSSGSQFLADPQVSVEYIVERLYELDSFVDEGHAVGVDVDGWAGEVIIEWSETSDCVSGDPASLVIAIFDEASNTVRREAVAGCTHPGDNFGANDGAGGTYSFKRTISVTANDVLVHIRPVYNGTRILVRGGTGIGTFPEQQYEIESEASSQIGGETRKVVATKTKPTLPALFDYVLFSGTTLTKN